MPENSPPSKAQIDRMIAKMDELIPELDAHRRVVQTANRRSKVSMILAIIGICGVIAGMVVAYEARESVQTFGDIRDESRRISCNEENKLILAIRSSVSGSLLVLADDPENLTPREQGLADAYARSITEDLKLRDCSPEGIAAYYQEE